MARGKTSNLASYLSKKKALISFELSVDAISESVQDMSYSQFTGEVLKIQDKVGFEMAESARKTMSSWLDQNNPRRIGVTGTASRNLFTKKVQAPGGWNGGSQVVWHVVEGKLTKANRYIRQGVKPHKGESSKAQANSNLSRSERGTRGTGREFNSLLHKLAEWARKRGLRPPQPSPVLMGSQSRTPERGIGPGPMTPVSIPDSNFKKQARMVWALWHSIKQRGTSVSYEKRFGSRYFDYPNLYAAGKGRNLRTMLRYRFNKQGDAYENLEAITYRFIRTQMTKKGRIFSSMQTRTKGAEEL